MLLPDCFGNGLFGHHRRLRPQGPASAFPDAQRQRCKRSFMTSITCAPARWSDRVGRRTFCCAADRSLTAVGRRLCGS